MSAEYLHGVEEVPGRSDRRVDLQAVLHPGIEIVGSMPGRRVDRAGAGLERHVIAQDAKRGPRVQRMLKPDVLELRALHACNRRAECSADLRRDSWRQRFGDD